MIFFATKVTVKKTLACVLALCVVAAGAVMLGPGAARMVSGQTQGGAQLSQKLKTNEDRVGYLKALGWDVPDTPAVEMEVQIPREFDAAYQEYNALQLQQGFDLAKFQGKRAMLYTFALNSYPTGVEGVTVSLLEYHDRVIAGDVSAPEADGFIHGLNERPDATN